MHSRRQKQWILISILLTSTFVGLVPPAVKTAAAHKVSVFAWVEGDTVYVESKFSGGRKPQNAPVEVYDAAGNLLLSGKTDSEGEFSFTAPKKSELKIVLHAGMGHRAEWTVRADEFSPTEASSPSSTVSAAKPPADAVQPGTSPETMQTARQAPATATGLTADQVQELVEKALDRKLKPVIKLLAESQQSGPTLSDIIGGIGYILGLVGLGAYIQFKRNRNAGKQSPGKHAS